MDLITFMNMRSTKRDARFGFPIRVDHSDSGSETATPPAVPSTASWSVSRNA